MVARNLPAGWRVAHRYIPVGTDLEDCYDVQRWETWKPEGWIAWLLRKPPVTGWRHLYGFGYEDVAYQWAWDTIKAREAAK